MQSKFHRGASAARGGDFAVRDGALIGKNRRELACDRKVSRIAPAGEESGVLEHSGSGTDGRQPAAGGMLGADNLAYARVGPKEFHAGSAGQENEIEDLAQDGGQSSVGMCGYPAPAGGVPVFIQRGDGDLDAGAAQQVDGRERLDLLETIGEQDKHGGHTGRSKEQVRRDKDQVAEGMPHLLLVT